MPPDPAMRRWSLAVVTTIVSVVGLSTFAYGGVEAWVQPLLIAAAGFLAVVSARAGGYPRPGWISVSLALLVAIAAVQLVPLPLGVLNLLSPARAQVLSELGDGSLDGAPAWAPLSYYSPSTRQALASLLVASAVFASVATTVRSAESITWLLTGLFAVGVAQSLLAILQMATEAPGVYWDASLGVGPWTGSFVNHSNFSQLVNATFGAGLGLLLMRSSAERRLAGRLSHGFSLPSYLQKHGSVLVGLAVQAVAIALSLSRGGVIGVAAAAAVVALTLGRHRRLGPTAWGLLAVPAISIAGLLAVGADALFDRIDTLDERSSYADRIELSKATLRVGLYHPVAGTGLGTHRYVFPAYDTTNSSALAEQADNDYAQLFEEMGAPGAALAAILVVVLLFALERITRTSRSSVRYALYGVLYAIVACGAQSLTDFGLRLPAVYCTIPALAGLVPAVSGIAAGKTPTFIARPNLSTLGVVATALGAAGWLSYQAWLDYRGERWFSVAQATERLIHRDDWEPTQNDYINLLAASETAYAIRPHDVEYAYWLNAYRWEAFTVGVDATQVVQSPVGAKVAERLVAEIASARRLCPTFGPLYTLEGQVLLTMQDPRAFARIEEGRELSPGDPEASYIAGYAACLQDPPDHLRAEQLLSRAVALRPPLFVDTVRVWVNTFGDEEFPIRLADDNPERLRQVAQVLREVGGHNETVEEVLQSAAVVSRERVAAGKASPSQIAATAECSAAEGALEEAAQLYRQALARSHANVNWRLALTDVLTKLQRYDEAFREARLCLRIKPGWQPAIQRMEQLSLLAPPDEPLQPTPAMPVRSEGADAVPPPAG
ncbi:O-antigen ligase family protein [Botrimarina mediterranea]|nr:O-antigen ligase family protein [Botrimarina mediterranea]